MIAQLADTCTQSLTIGYDLIYEPKYKTMTVLCSLLVVTDDKSMDDITTGTAFTIMILYIHVLRCSSWTLFRVRLEAIYIS
jgi:hypothetical protein